MNSRTVPTLVLAAILIVVVIGVGALMTFSRPHDATYSTTVAWSAAYPAADSMKIGSYLGDGKRGLFVQSSGTVAVLDSTGQAAFSQSFPTPIATSLGDLNGDGQDDIVVAAPEGGAREKVTVFSQGEQLWTTSLEDMGEPARVAVIHFQDVPEVIVGDARGQLRGLSAGGKLLWNAQVGGSDAVRGLDDALVSGSSLLVAANHDGQVALFDAAGKQLWSYSYPGLLRRIRSYDLNGDGTSELLLGGEPSDLVILDAATGEVKLRRSLGQILTEIREAELDGSPETREFLVGGKKGGVWAMRRDGTQLWSATVGGKVTELVALPTGEGGSQQALVGDDSGGLNLFDGKTGVRTSLPARSSGITRLDTGRLVASAQVAVADGEGVSLVGIEKAEAPIWYTPMVAALVLALAIAVAAWAVLTIPGKPATVLKVEDKSVDALQAERRMLHESIADVDRLRQAGEVTPDAYTARLKDLRGQLADVEVALQKAGANIKPETCKCPNCGGTLPIGVDRCEYCGQVVLQ